MARQVAPELQYPIHELMRFFRYQDSECAKLRLPSAASFAVYIARGNVAAATPEDLPMDWVGKWWITVHPKYQLMLALKFDPTLYTSRKQRTDKEVAKELSRKHGGDWTESRIARKWRHCIGDLGGYLRCHAELAKAA